MNRLARFEEHRWVGDKRSQIAHDVDNCTEAPVLEEVVEAEAFICFAPDVLPEVRNRGYRRCSLCAGARQAAAAEAQAD